MEEIYIKARAKVNLNLEVLGKRKDNYHNLESVFQKINLYDEIYIKKIQTDNFKLNINVKELNTKENIIYKAYMKLKEQYKLINGIEVTVNKKIPMRAGMAGGSTDCAAFIIAMNKLFELKLSKEDMEILGKSLGADVVPCFYNKAVKAEGIGDIITNIDTHFKYYMIIIKPEIACNTKEMYQKLDTEEGIQQLHTSENIIKALENKDIQILSNNLYNVFEEVVQEKEIIQQLKKELIKNGALQALMTGSGSCVYGVFKDKQSAKNAYITLKDRYQTYICTSYNVKRGECFDRRKNSNSHYLSSRK